MTRVVMGLLFDPQGKVLIAKRNQQKLFGGLWEFPGGKIEGGESVEDALVREIHEELNAPILIDVVHPGYLFSQGNREAECIPVTGSIVPADITLTEHEEFRFVSVAEIGDFVFSPHDYGALELILRMRRRRAAPLR